MCGINGAITYARGGKPIDAEEILRTRDHMSLRGPDGAGLWLSEDQSVALAHRRLAQSTGLAEQDHDGDAKVVQSLLLDSVRRHLIADVPVGAFLSAGTRVTINAMDN